MTLPHTAGWWADGEAFFADALARAEHDLDAPTLLPGWSRRTLVAHVARNADALVNLLTWARTGEETPMYASPAARDEAIEASAAQLPADLVADAAGSAARLAVSVRGMPDGGWDREVRTAQGRTVPASEVLWMRCREVWVHAVDLAARPGLDDVPDDLLLALVDDVLASWARRGESPALSIRVGDRRWGADGPELVGTPAAVAGLVTGRSTAGVSCTDGSLPAVPRWL